MHVLLLRICMCIYVSTPQGDFFKTLPPSLDHTTCFVLKHILHDWSDDEAVAILTVLEKSLAPGGKIVSTARVAAWLCGCVAALTVS